MSVAEQLGLADQSSDLLVVAGQRWEFWATGQPALTRCGGLSGLRSRLRAGDPAGADEVLHALATLGAVDGGDDVAAAAVLAWALLPGACTLAHRLASLTPQIDEVVAAALWVEVRTFPWRRCRKVAANVLLNTRVGVLRDCGATSQLQRTDRTWSRTWPVDPSGAFWGSWASTQSEHPPRSGGRAARAPGVGLREEGHHRRRGSPADVPRGGRRPGPHEPGAPGYGRADGQRRLRGGRRQVGDRPDDGPPPRPRQH